MPTRTDSDGQAASTRGLVPMHTDLTAPSRTSAAPTTSPPRTIGTPQRLDRASGADSSIIIQNQPSNGNAERTVPHGGDTVEPRSENTVKRGFRSPHGRSVAVCLALTVGIGAVLIPALYTVRRAVTSTAGGSFGRYLGQVFGVLLPTEGLPPTGPLYGFGSTGDTTASTTVDGSSSDSLETVPEGSDTPSDTTVNESEDGSEVPSESDTAAEITPPEDSVYEPDSTLTEPPDESDPPLTDGPDEPVQSGTTGTDSHPDDTDEQPSDSDTASEDSTTKEPPADTEKDVVGTDKTDDTDNPDEPVTTPAIPAGCYPIVPLDLSEGERGAGYIHSEADTLPNALPEGALWRQGMPAVLILHTHPYEGYGDGGSYYDPADGPLGVTDSPNDPDGVVALGIRLTRALRGQGVTVIHLRVSVTPDETADAIYARTAALVRYYCRLYPDIGLVLDLRRSAELTADGGVLQTAGSLRGACVAQVRLTVNGGRPTASVARDLAAALTIRARLWAEAPSLSRPVRVRDGDGLAGDAELDTLDTSGTDGADTAPSPIVLTVEFGSAGNTFSEAAALVAPMAAAIGELLLSETEGL